MASGKQRFLAPTPEAAMTMACHGVHPEIPADVTTVAKALISRCWSIKPDDRPSFSEILRILVDSHFSIFGDVDIAAVEQFIVDIRRQEYALVQ
jgi:hypothetical protein